jgi:hypothetical protein
MALIDNFTDKARIKNKSSPFGLALYSQKGQDNKSKGGDKGKGNKGKGKDKVKCQYCGIPGIKHEPDDCLAVNEKKRKEWEEKNKKK